MFGKQHRSQIPKPVKILFIVLIFLAIATALSYIVMLLWNAILPDVVGVKPLNIWKAAGLLLLAKILFGGIGKRSGWKHKRGKAWQNKWMSMSPEERQEAKSRWKARCSRRGESDSAGE